MKKIINKIIKEGAEYSAYYANHREEICYLVDSRSNKQFCSLKHSRVDCAGWAGWHIEDISPVLDMTQARAILNMGSVFYPPINGGYLVIEDNELRIKDWERSDDDEYVTIAKIEKIA